MKLKPESMELEDGRKILDKQKKWLSSQIVFASLDSGIQKQILKGNTAMTTTHEWIAKKFPIDIRLYKLIYRLTSNHVHSNPLSYLKQSNIKGRGLPGEYEVGYFKMLLEVINVYIAFVCVKHTELFEGRLYQNNINKILFAKHYLDENKPPIGNI